MRRHQNCAKCHQKRYRAEDMTRPSCILWRCKQYYRSSVSVFFWFPTSLSIYLIFVFRSSCRSCQMAATSSEALERNRKKLRSSTEIDSAPWRMHMANFRWSLSADHSCIQVKILIDVFVLRSFIYFIIMFGTSKTFIFTLCCSMSAMILIFII